MGGDEVRRANGRRGGIENCGQDVKKNHKFNLEKNTQNKLLD